MRTFTVWILTPSGWEKFEKLESGINMDPGTFWVQSAGVEIRTADGEKRIFASTFYLEAWP